MKQILIAEDDQLSQIVIDEYLSKFGTTHTVSDGESALEAFTQKLAAGECYDLVCLDIMMPKMDGQEVLRSIRKLEHEQGLIDTKASKIIMTTALSDPKNLMQAMVQGECNGYLTKPIDHEELCELLEELGFSSN